MRLLIVSDTHGNIVRFKKLLMSEEADLYCHLGDGALECQKLIQTFPDKKILSVVGNCDPSSNFPASRLLSLENQRIFMTHGDRYGVKFSLELLAREAKIQNASIALYGHTHKSSTTKKDGILFFNPGSLGRPKDLQPTYGVIQMYSGKVEAQVKRWEDEEDAI